MNIETVRAHLKRNGTCAETRFGLSAKRTSPFKSAGSSVQSTTGSRCVRISGSNAGYTTFCSSVKGTGYPLHSPVSPSLPLPCVTVCHHISTGVYEPCDRILQRWWLSVARVYIALSKYVQIIKVTYTPLTFKYTEQQKTSTKKIKY